jgi:hypothetical protein
LIVKVVGPPVTAAVWAPEVAQVRSNQVPVTLTGSLKVIEGEASSATFGVPFAGVVDATLGATSPTTGAIEMSSMPTHSSLPTALLVMILTWTSGWLLTAAGSVALTAVTCVARLGPVVASARNPVGTLVKLPVEPTRYWRATGWTASSTEPSISRRL